MLEIEPTLSSLLASADRGNEAAAGALFSALYPELRRLPKFELARHGAPMSLSATTLIHNTYIEFARKEGVAFADRGRSMSYASRVTRGLIFDHARSHSSLIQGFSPVAPRSKNRTFALSLA